MSQPMTIHCPRCGAAMSLTADYLAQYAGQISTCPSCNGTFTIPAPEPVELPRPLEYANPRAAARLFDDGVGLVMEKGSVGPDRCVKCNAPANGYRYSKTFYWHESAYYLLILAGIIVYAIVAMIIRKSGRVSVGLCPAHRAVRTRHSLIVTAIVLLGIGVIIGGPVMASNTNVRSDSEMYGVGGVLGGIFLLLAGAIYASVALPVLQVRKIDERFVYLKRAGAPFLEGLPKIFR
jgi:hypothetical protein